MTKQMAAEERQAPRGRVGEIVPALRPWLLAAAFFVVGYVVLVTPAYNPRSPLVSMVLQLGVAALAAAAAVLAVTGRLAQPWVTDAVAAAASAFMGLVLAVALHGSAFTVGGLSVAAANRTPAAVRYAETWHLVDYSYKGLPAFYPPLLPWLAGRFAALSGVTPWLSLKLVSIAFFVLAPLAAYVLWSRILSRQLALFVPLALAALVTLVPSMWQQPDSFVSLAVVVPWWIDTVYGVRRESVRRWPFWVAGLVGALVFCCYYYYFFPLALALLLTPLLDRVHRPTEPRPWPRRALVVGSAAVLAAVYWLPLAISILRAQQPQSLNNLWFAPDMALLRVQVFNPTLLGVLMLVGLLHLLLTWWTDRTSMAMLLVVAAGFLWYVLAAIGNVVGVPVLGFRTVPLIDVVLLVASIRGLAALATMGLAAVRRRSEGQAALGPALVAPVVVALLAFVVGQQYATGTLGYHWVLASHDTPLPNGQLQRYASSKAARPSVSERRLEGVVRSRFSGSGEPVVVSVRSDLMKESGFWAFNSWLAIYAHPAGEFHARGHLLDRLASTTDPAAFHQLARGNRFDPIDAFVLSGRGNRLVYHYGDVTYPYGTERKTVTFSRAQFSPSYWSTKQVGSYFVAVAR